MVITAYDGHAECRLSCNVYDISVNCEFKMICMQKMNVIAKNQWLFRAQCRYTKIAQRMFKYSDMQYTSLILIKY